MPKPSSRRNPPARRSPLDALLEHADFGIQDDDFLLYELGTFVDDDRATLDDPEFCTFLSTAFRFQVEENPAVRETLASSLRDGISREERPTKALTQALHAVEDKEQPLGHIEPLLRNFAMKLFEALERGADRIEEADHKAGALVRNWEAGSLSPAEMFAQLNGLEEGAVATCAELMLNHPDRPDIVRPALDCLLSSTSRAAMRVLAHLISEPMLPEDLEERCAAVLLERWPLVRPYVLWTLRKHEEEDLPIRWLDLLCRSNDPEAADRILDEVVRHGGDPAFGDDLMTALNMLRRLAGTECDRKLLAMLNDDQTGPDARMLIERFIANS